MYELENPEETQIIIFSLRGKPTDKIFSGAQFVNANLRRFYLI